VDTKTLKMVFIRDFFHLLDEEIYDFRVRVKHTLESPEKGLVFMNPEG
jgi:hypothetical protein